MVRQKVNSKSKAVEEAESPRSIDHSDFLHSNVTDVRISPQQENNSWNIFFPPENLTSQRLQK